MDIIIHRCLPKQDVQISAHRRMRPGARGIVPNPQPPPPPKKKKKKKKKEEEDANVGSFGPNSSDIRAKFEQEIRATPYCFC